MNSSDDRDNLTSFWNFLKLLVINMLTENEKQQESFRMKVYKLFVIFVLLSSQVVVFIVIYQAPFTYHHVSHIIKFVSIQFMYFSILKSKLQLSVVKKILGFLTNLQKIKYIS